MKYELQKSVLLYGVSEYPIPHLMLPDLREAQLDTLENVAELAQKITAVVQKLAKVVRPCDYCSWHPPMGELYLAGNGWSFFYKSKERAL